MFLWQVSEGKVEILDAELRRQLSLSTEDLRFADNIVKQVSQPYQAGFTAAVCTPLYVVHYLNSYHGPEPLSGESTTIVGGVNYELSEMLLK